MDAVINIRGDTIQAISSFKNVYFLCWMALLSAVHFAALFDRLKSQTELGMKTIIK